MSTHVSDLKRPLPKLLLHATVCVDELQRKLPTEVEVLLRFTELWHSTRELSRHWHQHLSAESLATITC